MTSAPSPEFSRLVPLARLGAEPVRLEISASAEERERLARRFDLRALDRLEAVGVLQRLGPQSIRLEAAFEAEFSQTCVVTLDPAPGKIAKTFTLMYGALEDAGPTEIDIDADEPVFEPLVGDAIDIGEAVAQELSLSLPEFPRLPDAVVEPAANPGPAEGPFAALDRLRRPSDA